MMPRVILLLIMIQAGILSGEAVPPVPDPFGLGERLALLDFLHDKHVTVPQGPAIEQLRDLYVKTVNPESTPNEEVLAERDRVARLRSALKRDFGVDAPDSASEGDLTSLLVSSRQARENTNHEKDKKAVQQNGEAVHPTSSNAPVFSYNKFSEFTRIGTPLRISLGLRNGPDGLERVDSAIVTSASLIFRGMDLARPGSASLTFWCSSRRWRLLEFHDVVLLADGTRIDLGKGEHSGDINDDGTVTESVDVDVSEAQLQQIAKASVVEGQIGIQKIVFDNDEHADFKELVGVLERLRRFDPAAIMKVIFGQSPNKKVAIDCATLDEVFAQAEKRAQEMIDEKGGLPAAPSSQPVPAAPESAATTPKRSVTDEKPKDDLPKHSLHTAKIGIGGKELAIYIHCETRPTKEQCDKLIQTYRGRATKNGQVVVKILEDGEWWPVAVDNLDGNPIIYPH